MKLSYYTTAFILAATLASCSAYKNTQMPDDLYYTKGADVEEYMAMNNSYNPEDAYIRSKVRNRQRFSAYNSNQEYNSSLYSAYPTYGLSSYRFGLNMGMGMMPHMFDPYMMGYGFSPHMIGYGGLWASNLYGYGYGYNPFGYGHLGMGYYGGYPFGMYGGAFGGYPLGNYYGGKAGSVANKPSRTFNANQYNRGGGYNNSNNNMMYRRNSNSNSFGSSMRNVFAPSNIQRSNESYLGNSSSRTSRSYENNSSAPVRTYQNTNSSPMRTGGGSSGGSSGGRSSGGGVSRPTRN